MLQIALMSSENRAASALARHYPGGYAAFMAAAAAKVKALGMTQTVIVEPTGLSPQNVSTAADLMKLAKRHLNTN
jgi:D-alanyl-D-alanine carboxypeptidase